MAHFTVSVACRRTVAAGSSPMTTKGRWTTIENTAGARALSRLTCSRKFGSVRAAGAEAVGESSLAQAMGRTEHANPTAPTRLNNPTTPDYTDARAARMHARAVLPPFDGAILFQNPP